MAETEKKTVKTDSPTMEDILNRAIPVSVQERLKQLEEEFEEPYRLHPDMVAVLDISTNSIGITDGVPSSYDVVTGSDLDREVRGDKAIAEHTKQGLRITDRYEIVLNHVPETTYLYKYTVVPRKQWEQYAKDKSKGLITPAQEVAGLMQRSGGAI